MNKSHQPSNVSAALSVEIGTPTPTMKDLAALSMPTDIHSMLSSVDSIVAGAMQHIDDSLKQSSAQVEAAKHALLQQYSGLEQAYGCLPEENNKASISSTEAEGKETTDTTDSFTSAKTEPSYAKTMLEEIQTNIDKALADMEGQLKTQQKQYESKVVAASLQTQQALQEKALEQVQKNAEVQKNTERLIGKNIEKEVEKSTEKSTEKEAKRSVEGSEKKDNEKDTEKNTTHEQAGSQEAIEKHADQAADIHKQAMALITSTN